MTAPRPSPPSDHLIAELKAIVGEKGYTQDSTEQAPFLHDQRGLYAGRCALLLRPATTAEVAAIVGACAREKAPLVPQGGNTGLVGGATPHEGGHEILLSLSRLKTIRSLDPAGGSLCAEAGCVLADIQKAAEAEGLLFPLSMASEGSAQIGGMLSTNAGGLNVLRYGTARDLALGLEVVLADGRILDTLTPLHKDNTGLDLKQLFIGAEGTLGIITAAVLKLFPAPKTRATAFIALARPADGLTLLKRAQAATGGAVSACELIPRIGLDFVLSHIPASRDPLPQSAPWYLLLEATSPQEGAGLNASFETLLAGALGDKLARDATLAQNEREAGEFWRLRESLPEAQKYEGGSIKHDVALPLSRIAEFLERAGEIVERAIPGIQVVAFGHLGDGNIHYNLSQPIGENGKKTQAERAAFLSRWAEMNRLVHDLVHEMGGSISAEHGIGRLKREELVRFKSETEMEMMRGIKHLLDPANIMNPGKIF